MHRTGAAVSRVPELGCTHQTSAGVEAGQEPTLSDGYVAKPNKRPPMAPAAIDMLKIQGFQRKLLAGEGGGTAGYRTGSADAGATLSLGEGFGVVLID